MVKLEQRLGYTFKNPEYLRRALTHSSYANENRKNGVQSNERLEFLGDSILGKVVAEALYRDLHDKPEGELTRIRAALVCEQSLADSAAEIGLGEHLLLGKGEQMAGRERPSINADAMEAVLAAVYLDGGEEPVRLIVDRLILSKLPQVRSGRMGKDFKTILQELVQREKDSHLSYRLTGESGPDHDKRFTVEVVLNGETIGSGVGHSKKEAEQAAAHNALDLRQKD
ncbi:MAG: ribonuclease III [Oscillospiraceae bacterium]|nr:ribonuclease III [Oscillospiraceae bacterium]